MGYRRLVERQKTLYGEYVCPDENGDDCAGCIGKKSLPAGEKHKSQCLLEARVLG